MLETLGLGPEQIEYTRFQAFRGEWPTQFVFLVDGVRVPGRAADEILAGLLAWASLDRGAEGAQPPHVEQVEVGGLDVTRVSSADGEVVDYLYARDGSAIRISGFSEATEWHAKALLDATTCRHVWSDSQAIDDWAHDLRWAFLRESSGDD